MSKEGELLSLLEEAVEAVDPRIRMLGGYQKQLRGAVEGAMDYVEEMVEAIPGAIEINRETFVTDPRVHAFFVNVEDLQGAFSRSPELRTFLEDHQYQEQDECCALLCMKMTEKSGFGMELEGEQVRRDVPQVTVSFSDHQIYAPAANEMETRTGLKKCIFDSLVANAVERISQNRSAAEHLDGERRKLLTRLRSLGQGDWVSASPRPGLSADPSVAELQQMFIDNEAQLAMASPCLGPEDTLQALNAVLGAPDQYVRVKYMRLKLNRMGVRLERDSLQSGNEVDLAEVELGDADKRVVVLARFPRWEMLPQEDFLDNVSRHFAI